MAKFVSEKIRMKSVARLAAVQATYMIAYSQLPVDEVIKDFVNGEVGRFVIEDNPQGGEENVPVEPMDKAYLEKSLNMFLTAGHSLERCDGTLQALLLCAMYEIVHTLDLDSKVVIQEYVDMAYAFFSKNEPKMVNALLDQIAKQLRQ